jgi:hypothetical protein
LDGVNFSDDQSTYKNNSALLGGSFSCTKCTMKTMSNTYEYNMANEGGVIYIESDSNLTASNDNY